MTTRRDFLARAMLTIASGSLLAACGGYDSGYEGAAPGAQPAGDDACGDVDIAGNHGHALVVPIEDVERGEERSYAIRGGSGHDHALVITADHFAALLAGEDVVIESQSGAGHTHTVTVSCA